MICKLILAFFGGRLYRLKGYWVISDLSYMARVNGRVMHEPKGWRSFTLYHRGKAIATRVVPGDTRQDAIWNALVKAKLIEAIQHYEAWIKIHKS